MAEGTETETERPCRRRLHEGRERGCQAPLNHLCPPHRPLQGGRNQPSLLVLKDLFFWGQEAPSNTKDPPSKEEADLPSKQEGELEELQQQKRVQQAQEKFKQKSTPGTFPGQSTTGGRMEAMGSPKTVGPSKESEVEGAVGPRQGLFRKSTTLVQRQECFQCQSTQETTSLLTRHSGNSASTRRSLSSSFTNCPSRGSSGRLARTWGHI